MIPEKFTIQMLFVRDLLTAGVETPYAIGVKTSLGLILAHIIEIVYEGFGR